MSRLLKAALIAPLILVASVTLLLATRDPTLLVIDEESGLPLLALIAAAILTFINIILFALGTPYYYFLKKYNAVNIYTVLLGGTLITGLCGFAISFSQHSEDLSVVQEQVLTYAGFGIFVSGLIWFLGLRPKKAGGITG